jgi:hypothetical protein
MTEAQSRLATFFKHTETEFGIFYPNHCLLAAYSDFAGALKSASALRASGWQHEDLIAVSGEEVVLFAEEHLVKHGLWGVLMTQLSRAIGTEAAYADTDLAAAKKGAGFVVVQCPTEDAKQEAWKILEPLHPLVARYYSGSGIEHLAGES